MWFLRQGWLPVSITLFALGLLAGVSVLAVAGLLVFVAGGFSRLWSRYSLRRVAYERTLPAVRAFEGEELDLGMRITNGKLQPLPWVELVEEFPEHLAPIGAHLSPAAAPGHVVLRRSTSLGWYERVSWRYRLRCAHRGYYRIGPATLRSGDIFGIYTASASVPGSVHVTVYPRLYALPELGFLPHRPFGEQRGNRPLFTDPTRVVGPRRYRPGDSLREIDWKGTARRLELLSRQFEPAATRQLLVALNADTMLRTWEGYDPEVLERAVSTAASIIRGALTDRYAAGLVSNGSFPDSDRPILLRPGRSPGQLTLVLEALAAIQPLTISSLEQSLAAAAGRIPIGSTIVLVAGLLPPGLVAEASRLSAAGHRVAVVWVADAPPPQLPPHLPLHDVSAALRRLNKEADA